MMCRLCVTHGCPPVELSLDCLQCLIQSKCLYLNILHCSENNGRDRVAHVPSWPSSFLPPSLLPPVFFPSFLLLTCRACEGVTAQGDTMTDRAFSPGGAELPEPLHLFCFSSRDTWENELSRGSFPRAYYWDNVGRHYGALRTFC